MYSLSPLIFPGKMPQYLPKICENELPDYFEKIPVNACILLPLQSQNKKTFGNEFE